MSPTNSGTASGRRGEVQRRGIPPELAWPFRIRPHRVENDYPIVPVGLVGGDDVYKSLVTRDSALGRLSRAISTRLTGEADMAMPLMRGIGPTLIPRPQRMYLRFGEPIDTTKPENVSTKNWVESVRKSTQQSLEAILADLLAVRGDDPFRELNPLAWSDAVKVG
jgi:1-acyl-sn-glycerol-3-phosphate acyltransferase